MVESVVIGENICFSTSIIWWVNVNQLYLPPKLLFEGVKGDEIIPFDDQVFPDRAVLIAVQIRQTRLWQGLTEWGGARKSPPIHQLCNASNWSIPCSQTAGQFHPAPTPH